MKVMAGILVHAILLTSFAEVIPLASEVAALVETRRGLSPENCLRERGSRRSRLVIVFVIVVIINMRIVRVLGAIQLADTTQYVMIDVEFLSDIALRGRKKYFALLNSVAWVIFQWCREVHGSDVDREQEGNGPSDLPMI